MEPTGLKIIIVFISVVSAALSANAVNDGLSINTTVPRIISRDEWTTQPLNNNLNNLQLPVNRVIVTHTASAGCDTESQCIVCVQLIQKFHMDAKKFDDIGYNFLIGGDGGVYEGRGWDKQGAHTKGYNAGSIGIAIIGTFIKQFPTEKHFDALRFVFSEGVRLGKLTDDFKVYPHRAFYETESPGDQVIKVIEHWPNYVGKFE